MIPYELVLDDAMSMLESGALSSSAPGLGVLTEKGAEKLMKKMGGATAKKRGKAEGKGSTAKGNGKGGRKEPTTAKQRVLLKMETMLDKNAEITKFLARFRGC